jgi:hypothetical protein
MSRLSNLPTYSKINLVTAGLLVFILVVGSFAFLMAKPSQTSVTSSNLITLGADGSLQTYDGTAITTATLDDVAVVGLLNGQILVYDSASGTWQNTNNTDSNVWSVANLTDISFVSLTSGDILQWDGSYWVNTGMNATVEGIVEAYTTMSWKGGWDGDVNTLIAAYLSANPTSFTTLTNVPAIGGYSYLISTFTNATNTYYQASLPNGTVSFTSTNATEIFNNAHANAIGSTVIVQDGTYFCDGTILNLGTRFVGSGQATRIIETTASRDLIQVTGNNGTVENMALSGVTGTGWTIIYSGTWYQGFNNLAIVTSGNGILFNNTKNYNIGNTVLGRVEIWLNEGGSGTGFEINGTSGHTQNLLNFQYIGILCSGANTCTGLYLNNCYYSNFQFVEIEQINYAINLTRSTSNTFGNFYNYQAASNCRVNYDTLSGGTNNTWITVSTDGTGGTFPFTTLPYKDYAQTPAQSGWGVAPTSLENCVDLDFTTSTTLASKACAAYATAGDFIFYGLPSNSSWIIQGVIIAGVNATANVNVYVDGSTDGSTYQRNLQSTITITSVSTSNSTFNFGPFFVYGSSIRLRVANGNTANILVTCGLTEIIITKALGV